MLGVTYSGAVAWFLKSMTWMVFCFLIGSDVSAVSGSFASSVSSDAE